MKTPDKNNWKVGNCYERDAFACQVDVGQEISNVPQEPSEYYCKQDSAHNEIKFILYEDDIVGHMCYQFLKNAGDTQGEQQFLSESQRLSFLGWNCGIFNEFFRHFSSCLDFLGPVVF